MNIDMDLDINMNLCSSIVTSLLDCGSDNNLPSHNTLLLQTPVVYMGIISNPWGITGTALNVTVWERQR